MTVVFLQKIWSCSTVSTYSDSSIVELLCAYVQFFCSTCFRWVNDPGLVWWRNTITGLWCVCVYVFLYPITITALVKHYVVYKQLINTWMSLNHIWSIVLNKYKSFYTWYTYCKTWNIHKKMSQYTDNTTIWKHSHNIRRISGCT